MFFHSKQVQNKRSVDSFFEARRLQIRLQNSPGNKFTKNMFILLKEVNSLLQKQAIEPFHQDLNTNL